MVELKSQKNLFHSKVVFDFLKSPTFRKALDSSSLAKIQAKVAHYKHFSQGRIESLAFQERAIADACGKWTGLWCGELWTGAGKSIIAARVALKFLKRGKKIIFICPNRMGIGNVADGIIQKFHRTFEHYKAPYRIGSLDEVTLLDDVHFFTPHAFVRMAREGDALFKKLIAEAGLLIVDEAHHFPEDPKDDQVIYGKIERLASKYFLSARKKVVTLTATHGRHDGKPVFRKEHPDFQITVNEAVQAGWCPEIHGLPVYLDVKAPRATVVGTEFSLNLKGKQLLAYLRKVAAVMIQVQKVNPEQQFCAFVRTIREAKKLKEIWNHEAERFGFKPVALLIGTMPGLERIQIKQAIQNQEYIGYITCDVGSESIDIPRMECVHLIRRTKSINRLVQSIGRVLRNHPEKRRALVVDYNLSERKIIRACQGLEAYAKYVQSGAKRLVSGGPLVPIKGTENADFSGITIGEERAWIERSLTKSTLKEGTTFGRLEVLEDNGPADVLCLCDCGEFAASPRANLRQGDRKSCGCIMKERIQATLEVKPDSLFVKNNRVRIKAGTAFTWLTVIKDHRCDNVECKCRCGRVVKRHRSELLKGLEKSCGCRGRTEPLTKGSIFTRLTVLEDKGAKSVKCRCKCGNIIVRNRATITSGNTKSCGCISQGAPLKRGRRFGMLKVVEDRGYQRVLCVCECGRKRFFKRGFLGKQNSSCGCIRPQKLPDVKAGQVFGAWTAMKQEKTHVLCRCKCGTERAVQRKHLYSGVSKSCGCVHQCKRLAAGSVYGHLTVISDSGDGIKGHGRREIKCRCVCGKVITLRIQLLKLNPNVSCGCKAKLRRVGVIESGRQFGLLTVIKDNGCTKVSCSCDCGKKTVISRYSLIKGQKSCGCLYTTAKRLKPGSRYGEWTILSDTGCREVTARCSCGFVKKHHFRNNLTSGCSKRCSTCGLEKNAKRLSLRNRKKVS